MTFIKMDNIKNINKTQNINTLNEKKCNCVPSGMCHSNTLLGCPHKHYFNKNNVWTCDIKK